MSRVRAVSAALRRHPRSVLLLWAIGAVVIAAASLTLADPALVMLALDPELVAVLVLGSVVFVRTSAAASVLRGFVALVTRPRLPR